MKSITTQKKVTLGILVLVAAGVVWFILQNKANNQTGNQETLKIGGAFALSGFASEWGVADLNGATLAVEEFNKKGTHGTKVELVVEDITSDSPKVISAVQKLINVDQVKVMIGPTWFDTFAGAAPIADENHVVMITPSGAITAIQADKAHTYAFSTWFRSDQEALELIRYLSSSNQKRVALFFGNDPFWQDLGNRAKQAAPALGVNIIREFTLNTNDVDFKTPLTQLKNIKPDVIVFGFNNEAQLSAFLKQRAEIYPESTLFSTESIEEFARKDDYKPLLNGVTFIAPKIDTPEFTQKYKKRFGIDPVFGASNSYDATNMILEALVAGKSSGEEIRDYLASQTFDTVTFGPVKFDEIGGVQGGEFQINLIQNGKIIPQND